MNEYRLVINLIREGEKRCALASSTPIEAETDLAAMKQAKKELERLLMDYVDRRIRESS